MFIHFQAMFMHLTWSREAICALPRIDRPGALGAGDR